MKKKIVFLLPLLYQLFFLFEIKAQDNSGFGLEIGSKAIYSTLNNDLYYSAYLQVNFIKKWLTISPGFSRYINYPIKNEQNENTSIQIYKPQLNLVFAPFHFTIFEIQYNYFNGEKEYISNEVIYNMEFIFKKISSFSDYSFYNENYSINSFQYKSKGHTFLQEFSFHLAENFLIETSYNFYYYQYSFLDSTSNESPAESVLYFENLFRMGLSYQNAPLLFFTSGFSIGRDRDQGNVYLVDLGLYLSLWDHVKISFNYIFSYNSLTFASTEMGNRNIYQQDPNYSHRIILGLSYYF